VLRTADLHRESGKLDALSARFRDPTLQLFAQYGMENVGYWTPLDNAKGQLYFLLSYPSREAREQCWQAFTTDPDREAAFDASEANGRLVAHVESLFLSATDYSPRSSPPRTLRLAC